MAHRKDINWLGVQIDKISPQDVPKRFAEMLELNYDKIEEFWANP